METGTKHFKSEKRKVISKSSRFLVMDISNSYTKYAISSDKKIGRRFSLPTRDVTHFWLNNLKGKYADLPFILASVVPQKSRLVEKVFGKNVFSISGDKNLGIKIDYPQPEKIGADRLANAVAAKALYGAPIVVVDFGTAVTFDVIDRQGAYCGGVIAPGLNAMTHYLHEKTALLPLITLKEPRRAIGKNTVDAMLVGAMTGYRGLVTGILNEIKKELKSTSDLSVVATGGQAALVTRKMKEIKAVNPLLTLEGLRMIAVYRSQLKHGKSD